MKGKIKSSYITSVKDDHIAGAEVEIIDVFTQHLGDIYKCKIGDKEIFMSAGDIIITDYSPIINWEQRRYEIAKDILSAFNPISKSISNPDLDAKCAIIYADALIKQLKSN